MPTRRKTIDSVDLKRHLDKSTPTYVTKLGISGILEYGGRILLGLRGPKETMSGLWCTPGGGVEPGEEMDAALAREFMEETGLSVQVIEGCSFCSVQEKIDFVQRKHTLIVFKKVVAHLLSDEMDKLKPNPEFVQLRWFDRRELARLKSCITASTWNALLDYRRY